MSLAQHPRASHSPAWRSCVLLTCQPCGTCLRKGWRGEAGWVALGPGGTLSVVLMSASCEATSFSLACAVSLWPGWWELLGPGGLPRLPLS